MRDNYNRLLTAKNLIFVPRDTTLNKSGMITNSNIIVISLYC